VILLGFDDFDFPIDFLSSQKMRGLPSSGFSVLAGWQCLLICFFFSPTLSGRVLSSQGSARTSRGIPFPRPGFFGQVSFTFGVIFRGTSQKLLNAPSSL